MVREGIVAHSTFRFAAGAGVVAASLLIAGPNPAQAVADKNGSGSYSNDDFRKNSSSRQGSTARRIASNWVKDVLGIGGSGVGDQTPKPDLDPPVMDLGTGGSDLEGGLAIVNSFATQDQTAMRSAAVAQAQAGDNISVAAPRSGSGYSGQPATSFQAPRVVVGNGRTPGTHVPSRSPAPEAVLVGDTLIVPAAAPSVPAVPAAIEINFPPLPPPLPPIERIRPAESVIGEVGTSTIHTVPDPLAGLVGLILIPAIGAVLGYRQARAAQSLCESLGT